MGAGSLAAILAAARTWAPAAGVTRLAELTGLDRLGFPLFHAVRPRSKSLSTAMGRGTTRRAAIVSALLEAIETDAAERVAASGPRLSLDALGDAARAVWRDAARDPLAITLDPDRPRHWLAGQDLVSGRSMSVPFDLVSQNLTGPAPGDTLTATIGLATGGNRAAAIASAIAELLEHDLEADWRRATPADRHGGAIDPSSVDDPAVANAMARVVAAGCEIHLWSLGHDHGIAAFLCYIVDPPSAITRLPPVGGGGCHPDRSLAALRAITEAAQGRAALIAGARDDLSLSAYRDPNARRVELVLSTLAFAPASRAWAGVPSAPRLTPEAACDRLLRVATARSSLPLIAVTLPVPHADFAIVKVVAPGLRVGERAGLPRWQEPPAGPGPRRPSRGGRRVLFVGPTLWADAVPPNIERRPPAVAGDFAALLDDPPEMIGLIDGCFETTPSVWHKEIMELLAAGTCVMGAASLGALRAAELSGEGMIAIGAIATAYRCDWIVRDDAVMLCHAPDALAFRPLTVALVDVEATLATMTMPPAERRVLQRLARRTSFRERTWPLLLDAFFAITGRSASVDAATLEAVPSLKRRDALALVAALGRAPPPVRPHLRPPSTSYHRRLMARSLATQQ